MCVKKMRKTDDFKKKVERDFGKWKHEWKIFVSTSFHHIQSACARPLRHISFSCSGWKSQLTQWYQNHYNKLLSDRSFFAFHLSYYQDWIPYRLDSHIRNTRARMMLGEFRDWSFDIEFKSQKRKWYSYLCPWRSQTKWKWSEAWFNCMWMRYSILGLSPQQMDKCSSGSMWAVNNQFESSCSFLLITHSSTSFTSISIVCGCGWENVYHHFESPPPTSIIALPHLSVCLIMVEH